MTARFHAWRAALRIAGRDARRAPGRTLLVVGMLALPVLGASAADVTLRSAQLSPEQQLERALGQADAEIRYPGFGPILQDPAASVTYADRTSAEGQADDAEERNGPPPPTSAAAVLAQAVPPHARKLERLAGTAEVRTRHGALDVDVLELETADPMTRGITTLKQGRHPVRRDEVAVTTHFLTVSGLRVGSRLTVRDLSTSYRIVGAYERPGELTADEVNALPGALLAPYGRVLDATHRTPSEPPTETFLVSVPGGFGWPMVVEANTLGVAVVSRDVTLRPPARSDVPLYREHPEEPTLVRPVSARATAAVTVVVLALAEVCLLAGPAFAVGAQRSRRQFGLIGAGGGEGRDIRAVVLSGGLIAGAVAAVVGTVLGIGLAAALRPLFEERSGARFAGLDPHPVDLLGIALLAVVAGLAAAALPALTAARQPVLAALGGRKGVRRAGRRLPVVGLAAFLLGTAIAVYGAMRTEWKAVVAVGSVIAETGVVAMTPAFMGIAGRLGRRWGLSPRLALRDAARNRARTAPAVAAVLAAVAGTVTVAAYTGSTAAQERDGYEALLPNGAVSVMADDDRGRDVPAARTAVDRNLPIGVEADVDQLFTGSAGCDRDGMCGYVEVVRPADRVCPLDETGPGNPLFAMPRAELRALARDSRCTSDKVGLTAPSGVLVGDANLLKVLGIDDPGAVAALARGRAVSLDRRNVDARGRVAVRLVTDDLEASAAEARGEQPPSRVVEFPTYQVPREPAAYGILLVVPPAAAEAAHIGTLPLGAYFTTTQPPSDAQKQKTQQALGDTGADVLFHLEEGPGDPDDVVPLALAIFAAVVTLGAAGTATGLARSDAETDLATLAAIGAPPGTRRLLSAFQCAVVAATGVVLGAVTGIIPAIGLRLVDRRIVEAFNERQLDEGGSSLIIKHVPIVAPWGLLAVLLVAVPVGAACLAALATSSRPTTTRRAA
ncbi:FtsX-like permease family protein [Streptomyces sp. NPDC058864]